MERGTRLQAEPLAQGEVAGVGLQSVEERVAVERGLEKLRLPGLGAGFHGAGRGFHVTIHEGHDGLDEVGRVGWLAPQQHPLGIGGPPLPGSSRVPQWARLTGTACSVTVSDGGVRVPTVWSITNRRPSGSTSYPPSSNGP